MQNIVDPMSSRRQKRTMAVVVAVQNQEPTQQPARQQTQTFIHQTMSMSGLSNVLDRLELPDDSAALLGQQQQAGIASLQVESSANAPSAEEVAVSAAANAGRQGGNDAKNASSSSRSSSNSNLRTSQNGVNEDGLVEESLTTQGESRNQCMFPTLPLDLQNRILFFLGSAPGLIHCEQTCRGLYQVIHNNDNAIFWKNCPGATAIYRRFQTMSFRERACIHSVLQQIRMEQKETENIIESCLGIPTWVALIDHLVNNHVDIGMDEDDRAEMRFHVRGDASFVLMELVQQSLINHFEQANCSLLRDIENSDSRGNYPVLTGVDFSHHSGIRTASTTSSRRHSYRCSNWLATHVATQFPQITMARIEKMMRRISLRGGVVKLSNDVYHVTWTYALGSIMAILTVACKRSFELHRHRREYNKKTVLASHQSIRDVAPFPYYSVNGVDGNETNELNFVLVPKQLEEVTFLPSTLTSTPVSLQMHEHARVYGDGWHVAIDSNREEDNALAQEQEILQAQEMYDLSQHDDDNDNSDYNDNDDDDIATDDDEILLPHTDEDAIILIVDDRLWFDNRAQVIGALKSLHSLVHPVTNCNFVDNRKIAVREGASFAIVHAMRQNKESRDIQKNACWTLSNIAVCRLDKARRDIIESGGVKACIRALARFPASPGVQAAGCGMIGAMWWDVKVRKTVADADALTAVLNAMNNHKLDGFVQRKGCYALFTLLRLESSWADAAVNLGCIDAVIDSMEKHREYSSVQYYG